MTVKVGDRVIFGFPVGASVHNVTFPNAPKPALCPQTKAANSIPFLDPDNAPPMPGFAQGIGWEGNCTFDAAGTYTFVCSTHPEMTGTVIVESATEPTPTPTPTATATPTATTDPDGDRHTHGDAGGAFWDRCARHGDAAPELVSGCGEQRHGG